MNSVIAYLTDVELVHVGNESNKANDAAWNTRVIGAAEAVQATKKTAEKAATDNKAAATAWKVTAGTEKNAAQADLTRAQDLLEDLTQEIAPIARGEATTFDAWNKAKATKATLVANLAKLGDNDTTGAQAVLKATLAA